MQRRDEDGVEAAAIAALVPLDGKRVLEVGYGKGRLTALAAARASSVYAFDPSAENVAAARAALTREQRRQVRFAVHDAEALDVARERFDVALCGWCCDASRSRASCTPCATFHAALAADGILVDTQPVSAAPPAVALDGGELGSLDMHEWLDTIHAVDERFAETIAAGLYGLEHESWFVVTDSYDSGPECRDTVSN